MLLVLLPYCAFRVLGASSAGLAYIRGIERSLGDHTPFQDIYGLMALTRAQFFSADITRTLLSFTAPPLS